MEVLQHVPQLKTIVSQIQPTSSHLLSPSSK